MQPRTKKGPLWANDAEQLPAPAPSDIKNATKEDVVMEDGERDEGISDLDWMKRRMKENVGVEEKVFDQSDAEDARAAKPKEPPVRIAVSSQLP